MIRGNTDDLAVRRNRVDGMQRHIREISHDRVKSGDRVALGSVIEEAILRNGVAVDGERVFNRVFAFCRQLFGADQVDDIERIIVVGIVIRVEHIIFSHTQKRLCQVDKAAGKGIVSEEAAR